MKEIPLSQGQVALVDDEDFERLSQYKWQADHHSDGWRVARKVTVAMRRHRVKMPNEILGCAADQVVDHRNHDSFDNRRSNLRVCTIRQNSCNRGKRRGCRFLWKGIFENHDGRYTARVVVDGRRRSVGTFATPEEAALAYNNAAIEHYGEFACLNKLESEGC